MVSVKIEISPYLRQFLIDKYGSEPIQFPQNSMFMRHITEGCAPPSIIKKIISNKFNINSIKEENISDGCLSESEQDNKRKRNDDALLSVYLPNTVFRCGHIVNVNDAWRLNYDSCRSIRKTADIMFWSDFTLWIMDYERMRLVNNEFYSRKNGLLDFLIYHNISEDYMESIMRQDRRRRDELLDNRKSTKIRENTYHLIYG